MAAMMERDPKQRIQTAEEVIRRLEPWAGEAVPAPSEPDETAGVPPRANSPLPVAEELEDTASHFVDPILLTDFETPSQTSQGTDPVASADQETAPEVALHRLTRFSAPIAKDRQARFRRWFWRWRFWHRSRSSARSGYSS